IAACPSLACSGGSDDPAPRVAGQFVGRVASSDALIAVVTNGIDVRAYVCDGTPTEELTIAEWFRGTKSTESVTLQSTDSDAQIAITFAQSGATGTVTLPDARVLSFTTSVATGDAGFWLYKDQEGEAVEAWAGWIVLPTGEMRGSQVVPTRTSIDVTFSTLSGTGSLPTIGTVTPAKLTTSNTAQGFQGCIGCLNCC
ncbi:MAG TPA: hypothetical protein VEI97_16045, partial [bacterium]|nr:hypothetical protein [bacterium]